MTRSQLISEAARAELAHAVLLRAPFRVGRRGDGTLLPDYFDGHRLLVDPTLLTLIAEQLARIIDETGVGRVAGEILPAARLLLPCRWPA